MERARHQCEAHLHQCFPPGAPPQLAHRFQETFCDTLTCDARHKAVAMLRPAVSAWRVWWWIGLVMAIVVNVAVLASLTWRNVQVRGAGTGEARCICWRHVSRLRFGRGAGQRDGAAREVCGRAQAAKGVLKAALRLTIVYP